MPAEPSVVRLRCTRLQVGVCVCVFVWLLWGTWSVVLGLLIGDICMAPLSTDVMRAQPSVVRLRARACKLACARVCVWPWREVGTMCARLQCTSFARVGCTRSRSSLTAAHEHLCCVQFNNVGDCTSHICACWSTQAPLLAQCNAVRSHGLYKDDASCAVKVRLPHAVH